MKTIHLALVSLCLLSLATAARAQQWVAGTNYTILPQPQATTVPAGKVEVMEVFSYGCPACNLFQPVMEKVKQGLPANAQLVFLPASFKPNEDWPMFQRAYFAAQSLGVAEKTHQSMFDAVWETGELSVVDPSTNRLKDPLPSIEDAARFYERVAGIKPAVFLTAARSMGTDTRMRAADARVIAMQVPGTPCLVVAGKYRVELNSLRSIDDIVGLVEFLVNKEAPAKTRS